MNKLKKILLWVIAVFLLVFIGASLFVAIQGKSIARESMEKALNRKVDVQSIKLRFPFSIEVNKLSVENLVKARQIIITPSVMGFLSGRIAISKLQLMDPEFFIVRQEDGSWNLPVSKGKSSVVLAGISINNGILNFTDKKVDPSGFSFKVKDIFLKVQASLLSLRPLNISFFLKSNIVSQDNKAPATLDAKGWVDLLRKDMKGKIALSGLDAVYFSPYYNNFASTPVENGRIFFNSDLNAKNNDLTADCHLNVKDLKFAQKEGKKDFSISVLDILTGGSQSGEQGASKEVNLDFVIKTKLDKPRIDWAKITGSVVAQSLGAAIINNPEETIDKVKNLGKDWKSLGKEILKNKIGNIFGTQQENAEGQ